MTRPASSPIRASRIGVITAVVVLVTAGCSDGTGEGRVDWSGCEIDLHTRAVLGAVEDPASVRGGLLIQLTQLPAGGWAVTEDMPASPEVLRYDGTGRFAGSMGVAGSGPLELSSPLSIKTDPTDSTWVADEQRRWVVFGPDGEPARELQAPGRGPIHGFTPSGRPFQIYRTQQSMPDGGMVSDPVVLVWSRDGESLDTVGPGRDFVRTGGAIGMSSSSTVSPLNDTAFVYPRSFAGEKGMAEWRGGSERLWLPFDPLLASVDGVDGDVEGPVAPRLIARDGEGGHWVLGSLRRLSTEKAIALGEELELPPPPSNEPLLKHAVSDGVVWHLGPDRRVTAVRVIDPVPEGFSGEGEFFVLDEDADTGLRTLRVIEMALKC